MAIEFPILCKQNLKNNLFVFFFLIFQFEACQQLTAVTSAETLAMSSSSAGLHLAYVHHGGQISPMLPSSHSPLQQAARESSSRIQHHSMRYPINQPHQYQWLPAQQGAYVTIPDTTPTSSWNLSPQAGPSTTSQQQISQDNPTPPVTSPYNYHK